MNDLTSKIDFQNKVYDTLNNLISSSDTKATISLSLQTFLISSIFGATLLSRDILNKCILCLFGISINIYLLFSIFTVTSVIGILLALLTYIPRKSFEKEEYKREGLTYYIHIARFVNSAKYSEKVFEKSDKDILLEYNQQNYNLAHIVKAKMFYVKSTIYFLFFNIIMSLLIAYLISINI